MKILAGSRVRFVIVALLWLLIWQGAYLYVGKEILLVSPYHVFSRLSELVFETSFWQSVGASFLSIMSGFLIAVVLGTLLAIITSASKFLYQFFSPAMTIVKSTPIASFIILALVWLPAAKLTSFIVFLMVIPMVWANVSAGIASAPKELLEMAYVFKFSWTKRISLIYIPAVTSHFLSAVITGIGLGWKAGIAAEVLAIPKNSIGGHLYNAKITLETADLFAWTLMVILLSLILEKVTYHGIMWLREKNDRMLGHGRGEDANA